MKYPKWFSWLEYWHGLGSDRRYKPWWWERRAYVEGLHDAAKIVSAHQWERQENGLSNRAEGFEDLRAATRSIHRHALANVPVDPDHGTR